MESICRSVITASQGLIKWCARVPPPPSCTSKRCIHYTVEALIHSRMLEEKLNATVPEGADGTNVARIRVQEMRNIRCIVSITHSNLYRLRTPSCALLSGVRGICAVMDHVAI